MDTVSVACRRPSCRSTVPQPPHLSLSLPLRPTGVMHPQHSSNSLRATSSAKFCFPESSLLRCAAAAVVGVAFSPAVAATAAAVVPADGAACLGGLPPQSTHPPTRIHPPNAGALCAAELAGAGGMYPGWAIPRRPGVEPSSVSRAGAVWVVYGVG